MSICGEPDGGPTKYGVAIVDICTGMLACNAILAALNARHRTGKGQKVEVSLYETSLSMLVNVASNYLVSGSGGGRFGNGHPNIVPYTTYRPPDAMVALGGRQRRPVRALRRSARPSRMGAAIRASSSNRARVENRDDHRRHDRAALQGDTADAWLDKLMAAGVPCGKINSVAQALADPHTAARADGRDGRASDHRRAEDARHPVQVLRQCRTGDRLLAHPVLDRGHQLHITDRREHRIEHTFDI